MAENIHRVGGTDDVPNLASQLPLKRLEGLENLGKGGDSNLQLTAAERQRVEDMKMSAQFAGLATRLGIDRADERMAGQLLRAIEIESQRERGLSVAEQAEWDQIAAGLGKKQFSNEIAEFARESAEIARGDTRPGGGGISKRPPLRRSL